VAQALGLQSVAEGVETREQLDTITDMGCDSAQGFFLSRPREPDVIEPLLRM
jgi:EAL domain-containing protein (putative c-di-GMP-specific phosphodiesterase class I)